MPSRASVTMWKATSSRLWRFTIDAPAAAAIVSSIDVRDLADEAIAAERLGVLADRDRRPTSRRAARRRPSASASSPARPECRSRRRSRFRARRRGPSATTGRPQACDFERHDPEILFAGKDRRDRRSVEIANLLVGAPARETARHRRAALRALPLGPVADDGQWHAGARAAAIARSTRLYGTSADTTRKPGRWRGAVTPSAGV